MEIEIHPYEIFIPDDATKLIIGTIPPERFSTKQLSTRDVNFYYGSEDNYFWDLINDIFKTDFQKINNDEEVNKRKFFLESNKIGICDIIKETIRIDGSSLDQDLRPCKYLDIVEVLEQNPSIKTLIYTSANGGVKTFMNRYLRERFNQEICHNTIDGSARVYELRIPNLGSKKVIILYSPSPTALRNLGQNGQQIRLEQWQYALNL